MSRKGGHWCSVSQCHNDSKSTNKSFFRFPKSPTRCMDWMRRSRREDLLSKGVQYANANCRICSDHFGQLAFTNDLKNRLNPRVVPSIFPWTSTNSMSLNDENNNPGWNSLSPPTNSTNLITPTTPVIKAPRPFHHYSASTSILKPLSERNKNADNSFSAPIPNSTVLQTSKKFISILKPLSERLSSSETSGDTVISSPSPGKGPPHSSTADLQKSNSAQLPPRSIEIAQLRPSSSSQASQSSHAKFDTSSLPTAGPSQPSSIAYKETSTQTPKMLINSIFNAKKRQLERQVKSEKTKVARLSRAQSSVTTSRAEINLKKFQEILNDFLPEALAKWTGIQAELYSHQSKGRRYPNEFKQFALHVYYMNPQCYRFLRKIFLFPTVRCLQKYTEKWDSKPGFNENILESLRSRAQVMREMDRQCVLCMDEMSLKANLFYDASRDRIVGLPTLGNHQNLVAAGNVLVLMARGITSNWKQALGYYFVQTTCKAPEIERIMLEAIDRLDAINLKVRCVISDMGSNFLSMTGRKNITVEQPFFIHNGRQIFYMFDTPHLLKAVRNNLIKYQYLWDNKVASWRDIETFYLKDSQQRLRMAPKLSTEHINPTNFQRMKVRFAAQLLSHTVAAAMSTHIALGSMDGAATGTCTFIEKMDEFFGLFNSSSFNNSKESRLPFHATEHQLNVLDEMYEMFSEIAAVDPDTGDEKTSQIHCFRCWQQNINSLRGLWTILHAEGVEFILTRRLNQDCLENFFGSIRNQGGNSKNPTPIQFVRAFKKLAALKIIEHVENANCEEDFDAVLNVMYDYVQFAPQASPEPVVPLNALQEINNGDYMSMQITEVNTLKYISGYLMRKCLQRHFCEDCLLYANTDPNIDRTSLLCLFRAYKSTEENVFGSLLMPSEEFNRFVYNMEETFVANFPLFSMKENVGQSILEAISLLEFQLPCLNFPLEYLRKLYIRMRIYYTLKFWNEGIRNNRAARAHVAAGRAGNRHEPYYLRMQNLLHL